MSIKAVNGGTPTDFPDSWQLAPGHYEDFITWPATTYDSQTATTTEPYVIYPRPDTETANAGSPFARHRWAHGSMDYEIPICIRGGAFPYHMEIYAADTDVALTGTATVGANFDSTDSYILNIPAATIAGLSTATDYGVGVKVTDQSGNVMRVWFSFQKEATELDHFFFVDNSWGGTADGKYATPFASLNIANWLHAGDAANSNRRILVVKEGNSQTPASEYTKDNTNGSWLITSTAFMNGIINIPGENPVINLQELQPLFGLQDDDIFVHGIKAINGREPPNTDGKGAFMDCFANDNERMTISESVFDTVTSWTAQTTTNNGALTTHGTASERKHIAIVGTEFANFVGSAIQNVGSCIVIMGWKYGLIDNLNVHDYGTGGVGSAHLIFGKHTPTDLTIRRITAYEAVTFISGQYAVVISDDNDVGSGYLNANMEVCYINLGLTAAIGGYGLVGIIKPSLDYAIGPFHVYRNTGYHGNITISTDAPTYLDGNVHTVANNTGDADDITITDDYFNATTDYEADRTLTTTYLTSIGKARGTVGHEIV